MALKDEVCFLPKFTREDVISAMDASRPPGWHVTAFEIPSVWQYSKGEGVKIAVLDSGADLKHPDLKDNLLPGYNFVMPQYPPNDDNCHGSHVTGIICGTDTGQGVVGIAPRSKVMPVKVLNSQGTGTMDKVVAGIRWAVDNGADIISMSLGTRNPLEEVRAAIIEAATRGVVTFCAAGNAGSTRQLLYPAAYTETISIGAVDENSMRASFSCTGPNLDFVAPGVNIYSTVPPSWYAYLSGTSMAAPFAVGVAALILSFERHKNPSAKLAADDYRRIMKENVLDVKGLDASLDANGKRFFQGFGIINPAHFQEWVEQRQVAEIQANIQSVADQINMIKDPAKIEALKAMLATAAHPGPVPAPGTV
jgi:subtilisin family serine protease